MQFNYNLTFYRLQLFNNFLDFILLVNYYYANKPMNFTIISHCKSITAKNN